MKKLFKVLWLGILSAGILSNPALSYPGRDSGIFLYIGSLVLKGKIPYVDAWENKGPLIFYLNALGIWLAGGSRWGIWLIEFTFFCISGYLAYRVIKGLMGEVPALLGTSIFFTAAGNVLQGGNYSEEYSLLFSLGALFFFTMSVKDSLPSKVERPSSGYHEIIIGLTLGFNLLLRPNNISIQAAIAVTYLILTLVSKDWKLLVKRALQILAGMLIVLIPVILYFAANNALTEMINVVIKFNAQYSAGGGVSRIFEGALNAANGIGLAWIGLAATGYALAALRLLKNKNPALPQDRFLLVLLNGLPIEAVLSTVSGKNYPHYFIGWAVYVGLLSAYVIYAGLTKFSISADKHAQRLVLALIVIACAARFDVLKNYAAALSSGMTDYRDPVAEYIQRNTAPEDQALVWGFRPIINFAAQRETPVTYLPYPLSHVDTPLARRWADEFYAQIVANPPVLIVNMIEAADRERIPDLDPEVRKGQKIKWKEVVLAHNYKAVLEFIRQNYVKMDSINGYDVYKLKLKPNP